MTFKPRYVLFIALFTVCFFSFRHDQPAVKIDGVIGKEEWGGAGKFELSGGGTLLTMRRGSELYVALAARKSAWCHICLRFKDTVRILHASAALGEANYVRRGSFWRVVQPFDWALRNKDYNETLLLAQFAHYLEKGWVANNNNMGDGSVFEFKLDLKRSDRDPVLIACVLAEIPNDFHYFPLTLSDNTLLEKLVQGYTPDSLQFNPSGWHPVW